MQCPPPHTPPHTPTHPCRACMQTSDLKVALDQVGLELGLLEASIAACAPAGDLGIAGLAMGLGQPFRASSSLARRMRSGVSASMASWPILGLGRKPSGASAAAAAAAPGNASSHNQSGAAPAVTASVLRAASVFKGLFRGTPQHQHGTKVHPVAPNQALPAMAAMAAAPAAWAPAHGAAAPAVPHAAAASCEDGKAVAGPPAGPPASFIAVPLAGSVVPMGGMQHAAPGAAVGALKPPLLALGSGRVTPLTSSVSSSSRMVAMLPVEPSGGHPGEVDEDELATEALDAVMTAAATSATTSDDARRVGLLNAARVGGSGSAHGGHAWGSATGSDMGPPTRPALG